MQPFVWVNTNEQYFVVTWLRDINENLKKLIVLRQIFLLFHYPTPQQHKHKHK
jgi:hypothetical protein